MTSWPCPVCTLINRNSIVCDACGHEQPKGLQSKSKPMQQLNQDDDEDEDENLYRIANKFLEKYVEELPNKTYKCKLDGKIMRTKELMKCYLVRYQKNVLLREAVKRRPTKVSGIQPSDSRSADEELALQIAMDDYDKMIEQPAPHSPMKRGKKTSGLNSLLNIKLQSRNEMTQHRESTIAMLSHQNRLVLLLFFAYPARENQRVCYRCQHKTKVELDDELSDSNDADISDESWKQARLEKLLSKTDRIVKRLQTMIHRFVDTHETASTVVFQPGSSNSENLANSRNGSSTPKLFRQGKALRDYQTGGVEWLCSLHANGLNGSCQTSRFSVYLHLSWTYFTIQRLFHRVNK